MRDEKTNLVNQSVNILSICNDKYLNIFTPVNAIVLINK